MTASTFNSERQTCADPLDAAALNHEDYVDGTLAQISAQLNAQRKLESRETCVECGERIAKQRREILQGVQTCVQCAQ